MFFEEQLAVLGEHQQFWEALTEEQRRLLQQGETVLKLLQKKEPPARSEVN